MGGRRDWKYPLVGRAVDMALVAGIARGVAGIARGVAGIAGWVAGIAGWVAEVAEGVAGQVAACWSQRCSGYLHTKTIQ